MTGDAAGDVISKKATWRFWAAGVALIPLWHAVIIKWSAAGAVTVQLSLLGPFRYRALIEASRWPSLVVFAAFALVYLCELSTRVHEPMLDVAARAGVRTIPYAYAFLAFVLIKDLILRATMFEVKIALFHFVFGATVGMLYTVLVTIPTGALSGLVLRWSTYGWHGPRTEPTVLSDIECDVADV